ncbi:MAG: lipopolysaccharide transport periplasmic protein LptA [Gammaproteobacteria bacterium]
MRTELIISTDERFGVSAAAIRFARRFRQFLVLTAAAVTLLMSGPGHALSTDREQPIDIKADSAEADERKRVTIYRGNAIIVQGSLRITGDTIWIHLNEDNEFIKLVSEGRPARMRQQPDGEVGQRTADARRLEYHADTDRILMRGKAVYVQDGDRISAENIEYDSLRGRMIANSGSPDGGDSEQSERVHIQIQPKKKKQQ